LATDFGWWPRGAADSEARNDAYMVMRNAAAGADAHIGYRPMIDRPGAAERRLDDRAGMGET
jgi:hypothetical protein